MLELGVLVVEHAEAQRLFGDNLHQHQVAALQKDAWEARGQNIFTVRTCLFSQPLSGTSQAPSSVTDQDVSLVRVGLFTFLGDEQQLVKQEEGALVLGSLQTKRPLQNQLSVADQIGAFPVGQQALDFLQKPPKHTE